MPQLDAVTYLSQVFWLSLTFVGYYLLALRSLIPALARRRKVRHKKLALAKGAASGATEEEAEVRASYAGRLAAGSQEAGRLLSTGQQKADQWRRTQGKATQTGPLAKANQAYLNALATVEGQTAVRRRF